MEKQVKQNSNTRIVNHSIGLLTLTVIFSIASYFTNREGMEQKAYFYHFLQALTGICMVIAPIVYFNIYFLIPKYLAQKKYLNYILGAITTIAIWGPIGTYFENWSDHHWFDLPQVTFSIQESFLAGTFILIISTLIRLSYHWFLQLSRIKQIENDRLNIELSLLKNQINPHFFFNTLNNLYALALEKSEQTPEIILTLSQMMRYTIYDCKEPEVSLSSEIKYLENYIALQQIRLDNGGDFSFEKDISDDSIKIAPMILIVFLENAFKHGLESLQESAFIKMNLTSDEQEIRFSVENNYSEEESISTEGLGLQNVKRRLSLIYRENHNIKIEDKNGVFKVSLRIKKEKV